MDKRTQTMDRGRLEKVLWTDKSKFEVFGSQRTFVRSRKLEKMLEECLMPSVKPMLEAM